MEGISGRIAIQCGSAARAMRCSARLSKSTLNPLIGLVSYFPESADCQARVGHIDQGLEGVVARPAAEKAGVARTRADSL